MPREKVTIRIRTSRIIPGMVSYSTLLDFTAWFYMYGLIRSRKTYERA